MQYNVGHFLVPTYGSFEDLGTLIVLQLCSARDQITACNRNKPWPILNLEGRLKGDMLF